MEMSGNAQRALEQVKMGLYMLYGANYFTDEEWIKIDGLVHKGKYVFTQGPPSNILEEPLMTFEETNEEAKDVVQLPEIDAFDPTKLNSIIVTEEEASSPSSEQANSTSSPFPAESPDETPLETSDEDSYVQRPSITEPAAVPRTSDTTTSAPLPPAGISPRSETSNGLPPGCTQEQLDEVRAFNATLTKAGNKTRPKYAPVEEYPPEEWIEDFPEQSREEQFYPSPAPTEQEARINTWADGVAQEPNSTQAPHVESPAPRRAARSKTPTVELLAEQFIKAHGRQPKSLNDFYQPNNPNHHPRRPESRASMTTGKTTKSIKSTAQSVVSQLINGNPTPQVGIVLGKVYTAQSSAPQKGIRIEIRAGDPIRIVKFVSGVMYIGENLRSKERGQFPEMIFKRASSVLHQQNATAKEAGATFQRGLDQVENVNAAEWDDVPIKRAQSVASVARPYMGGGLAASRFSVLADRESASQNSQAHRRDIPADMAGQIGQMVNDKVNEILKAQGIAPSSVVPTKPASKVVPSKPASHVVQPKTETCWYWSVKNDCRFTAEECRDLHAFVPNKPGEPTNLRMGKPTWGALADSLPSPTSNQQSSFGVIGDAAKVKGKSCYYWAVEKNCSNSAESCKYLHAYSPLGIAAKPGWTRGPSQWQKEWRNLQEQDGGGDEEEEGEYDEEGDGDGDAEGELVLEEVGQGELDGWGQPISQATDSSWGGNALGEGKYRPPHIKAMEEQASHGAIGW